MLAGKTLTVTLGLVSRLSGTNFNIFGFFITVSILIFYRFIDVHTIFSINHFEYTNQKC